MPRKKVKKCEPGKKCVDVYLGGEWDVGNHIPKNFEYFFSKKWLLITLLILVLALALSEVAI